MLLIVYDPDIPVLAERRLHDGSANAIHDNVAGSGYEAIERHGFTSRSCGENAAEQNGDSIAGKENSCKPYEKESRPYQYGKEQLSFQR